MSSSAYSNTGASKEIDTNFPLWRYMIVLEEGARVQMANLFLDEPEMDAILFT